MATLLEQLKFMTAIVADTGDIEASPELTIVGRRFQTPCVRSGSH